MKRVELERAWPAAEPPPGFSERVLERLQLASALSEPVPRRATALRWRQARRVRWLLLAAVALALAGMLLLSPADPAREGDVFAAEPRVVAIGERAVAEMSRGAHIRWSGDGSQQAVHQDRGAVTYHVLPGAAFRVQTPHGNVTVLGTQFRVVVADREVAGGEPMKKRWAIPGAGATLGALLWVGVDRGSVRLSKDEEELVLHAGQAGAIGSDGIPRPEAAVLSAPAHARQAGGPAAERARARQRADGVRRRAAQRRTAEVGAKQNQAPAKPSAPDQPIEPALPKEEHSVGAYPSGTPSPGEPEAARSREYIQRTVREQYFPAARECYEELLERQPTAAGKIVLEFAIVSDGDAGVVDRVEIREDNDTIDDREFQLCMRESMYTAVFEPPPPDVGETTVVYPVMLAPE